MAVTLENGTVHIAVSDRGTGIAPDILNRLFEPFLTTKSDGLGLGLSISRTIVAVHGGRLWGENNPDGGATLHCVLPVAMPASVSVHGSDPTVLAST
jgi:two-component system sensor kinase FixL